MDWMDVLLQQKTAFSLPARQQYDFLSISFLFFTISAPSSSSDVVDVFVHNSKAATTLLTTKIL